MSFNLGWNYSLFFLALLRSVCRNRLVAALSQGSESRTFTHEDENKLLACCSWRIFEGIIWFWCYFCTCMCLQLERNFSMSKHWQMRCFVVHALLNLHIFSHVFRIPFKKDHIWDLLYESKCDFVKVCRLKTSIIIPND